MDSESVQYKPTEPLPAYLCKDENGKHFIRVWSKSYINHYQFNDYYLRPQSDYGFYSNAYLHALPRKASKKSYEYHVRSQIENALQERAWVNDVKPSRLKKVFGCSDRDRKKFHSVRNKAGKLFNYLYKQLVELDGVPESLKIAYKFPPSVRGHIYDQCLISERFKQICVSFPLAAACSIGTASLDFRCLLASIELGKPLSEIAEIIGMPLWTRKIRSQNVCYLDNIKNLADKLPKEIANTIPTKTIQQNRWICAMNICVDSFYDHRAGLVTSNQANRIFLKWLNSNIDLNKKKTNVITETVHVRDWVSYNWRQGDFNKPPVIKCSWKNALKQADEWLRELNRRIIHDQMLANEASRAEFEAPFPEQWIKNSTVDGYVIEYLHNEQALIDEGKAMGHCVASYAYNCRRGACQIYSVKDLDGNRLATAEVTFQTFHIDTPSNKRYYNIAQIRGKYNSEPPEKVKRAMAKYISSGWVNGQESTAAE